MIVQHDALGHVLSSLGHDDQMDLILEYDSEDPHAVRLVFDPRDGMPWRFGRSILADALIYPGLQGDCDVKASLDVPDVRIFLDSPGGTISVKINALLVSAFITEIYSLVSEDEADKTVQDQLDTFLSQLAIEDEDDHGQVG